MSNSNKSDFFKQHGYTKISAALPKAFCDTLASYVRLKASVKPKIHKGSDPLTNIHREYGDLMMETLAQQLQPEIERHTGLSLWPSLTFCYHYLHGNTLAPHKDRESCEIVAGLYIGHDEQYAAKNQSYPICLNINGETVEVGLTVGDIVIFKGSETEHFRKAFEGEWFVSAIFAYVDKNGPYAYQKYDQRKSLGRPHVGMFRWFYGKIKHKLTTQLHALR